MAVNCRAATQSEGQPVAVGRVMAAGCNCSKKKRLILHKNKSHGEGGGGGEGFFRQNTCLRVTGETPHVPEAVLRLPERMKNADIAAKQ